MWERWPFQQGNYYHQVHLNSKVSRTKVMLWRSCGASTFCRISLLLWMYGRYPGTPFSKECWNPLLPRFAATLQQLPHSLESTVIWLFSATAWALFFKTQIQVSKISNDALLEDAEVKDLSGWKINYEIIRTWPSAKASRAKDRVVLVKRERNREHPCSPPISCNI